MKLLGTISRDDWREIGSMSAPLFIETLSMALIGMLVSMLVKRTGMAAVASVNLLNILNQLFQQVFLAMGVAVTVTVAQHRGRGDVVSTGKTASQAMMMSLGVSIVMAVLCFAFMNQLLMLILADSEALVYQYSTIYLSYCIASIPFMSVYYVTTGAIRGSGKPNISLIAALVYNGSYALMSVLAVVWLDAGIVGVSIAMLLSRVFSALAGVYLLKRGNENLKVPKVFSLHFEKQIIKPVILISIPICLENLLFQGGKLITQTFAVPFGTNAIAVNGIVNNLFFLMMVPGVTAANAATPIVGRYIGMRNFKEARNKAKQLLFISIVVATFTSALIYVFTPALARFYTDVPQIQKQILSITGLCCLVVPFLWAPSFLTPAALRGAGDVRYTTAIAVFSMLTLRVGSSYVLAIVLGWGVQGILGRHVSGLGAAFNLLPMAHTRRSMA